MTGAMYIIGNHDWEFDGDAIFCRQCRILFQSAIGWVEFKLAEKAQADEKYMKAVEESTDAYLSRTLRGLK